MKTRNKIILSLVGVVLSAVIIVICIVAILAAQTQTIVGQVSVSYKATNVIGSASARYYVGGKIPTYYEDLIDMDTNGSSVGGDTILNFNSDTSNSLSLSPQENLTLKNADDYVFLFYKFKNTGTKVYNVDLTFTGTIKNIIIYSGKKNLDVVDSEDSFESDFRFEGYFDSHGSSFPDPRAIMVGDEDKVEISGETDDNKTFTYNAGKVGLTYHWTSDDDDAECIDDTNDIVYVYFMLMVEDVNKDATFSGSFNWNLTALDEDRQTWPFAV